AAARQDLGLFANRLFDSAAWRCIASQQGFDFGPQVRLSRALRIEERRPLGRGQRCRAVKELFESRPVDRAHGCSVLISRRSQASAMRRSRRTVAIEIPRIELISSIESPPK